ncbi:hypothetical protein WNZ14_07600 [Hoeflea sp. AS60]|uniref:hypothetical protein n=1 Tax=Hoeflea sp. AS60 TaxID=3135780 RepID=UPI00316D77D8
MGAPGTNYLQREESFMYDREVRYKMEETMNEARIEYTEKGVMHLASRRCQLLGISPASAVLGILTQYKIPQEFCLDIPEARISNIGCVLTRTYGNNTVEVRFLRQVTEKEMHRIFVFSAHPNHRDHVMDVRSW